MPDPTTPAMLTDTQREALSSSLAQVNRLVLGKPLGVGVLSAALKKDAVDASGYARMIETTTQLNTPGPALAFPVLAACGFGMLTLLVSANSSVQLTIPDALRGRVVVRIG